MVGGRREVGVEVIVVFLDVQRVGEYDCERARIGCRGVVWWRVVVGRAVREI